MSGGGWLSGLLDLVKGLTRIADALERIADVQEGVPRPRPHQAGPPDQPYEVGYRDEVSIRRLALIEQELTPLLGRLPTEDELVARLDDIEWSEGDVEEHRRRVRASVR